MGGKIFWIIYAYLRTKTMVRKLKRIGKIEAKDALEALEVGCNLARTKLKKNSYYTIEARRADAPSLRKLFRDYIIMHNGKPGPAHAWKLDYYRGRHKKDYGKPIVEEDSSTIDLLDLI